MARGSGRVPLRDRPAQDHAGRSRRGNANDELHPEAAGPAARRGAVAEAGAAPDADTAVAGPAIAPRAGPLGAPERPTSGPGGTPGAFPAGPPGIGPVAASATASGQAASGGPSSPGSARVYLLPACSTSPVTLRRMSASATASAPCRAAKA